MLSTNSEPVWHKIAVSADPSAREALMLFFFELGSCGLEETNDQIIAYFKKEDDFQQKRNALSVYRQELLSMGFHVSEAEQADVPSRNWNQEWQAYFKPVFVTDRLTVKPPWEKVPDSRQGGLVVDIMPKMAFGTGTHETTQLCMQMLESLPLEEKSILDAGTGSGILSIVAIKLKAASAVGVDVDPDAIENAFENAELNHVSRQIEFRVGGFDGLSPASFDVVVANINRVVLSDLIAQLIPLATPDAIFIFSGILAEDDSVFSQVLGDYSFGIQQKKIRGEWIAYQAIRKA